METEPPKAVKVPTSEEFVDMRIREMLHMRQPKRSEVEVLANKAASAERERARKLRFLARPMVAWATRHLRGKLRKFGVSVWTTGHGDGLSSRRLDEKLIPELRFKLVLPKGFGKEGDRPQQTFWGRRVQPLVRGEDLELEVALRPKSTKDVQEWAKEWERRIAILLAPRGSPLRERRHTPLPAGRQGSR